MSKVNNEAIILLHGLARTARSMRKLAQVFNKLGYQTVNVDYASRRFSIETLSEQVVQSAINQCQNATRIHFVTRSLGGILVRFYLGRHDLSRLGHVVMLGPPNHGSELADKLRSFTLYRWLLGPAAMQLGTNPDSVPNQLGIANFSVGIIAGNRSINWLSNLLLPSPNDGTVSVASTCLTGMQQHLILPVNHFFMMNNKHAIQQCIHFIQHGRFAH